MSSHCVRREANWVFILSFTDWSVIILPVEVSLRSLKWKEECFLLYWARFASSKFMNRYWISNILSMSTTFFPMSDWAFCCILLAASFVVWGFSEICEKGMSARLMLVWKANFQPLILHVYEPAVKVPFLNSKTRIRSL